MALIVQIASLHKAIIAKCNAAALEDQHKLLFYKEFIHIKSWHGDCLIPYQKNNGDNACEPRPFTVECPGHGHPGGFSFFSSRRGGCHRIGAHLLLATPSAATGGDE
ncbi:hypothetical protein [Pseudomonas sp. Irchel 3E20]|uniref:hypothetical protein n=1 Tax=Pseudomonas sp. Irchel 3E20 TaxID=2008983 RepID=UPI0011403491|nr:hypothetical protein [Pseudomonas sp. Irchel 3E20]